MTLEHSEYPWQPEQSAAAVTDKFLIGAFDRVGAEDLEDASYYGPSCLIGPGGNEVGDTALDTNDLVVARDPRHESCQRRPSSLGFPS